MEQKVCHLVTALLQNHLVAVFTRIRVHHISSAIALVELDNEEFVERNKIIHGLDVKQSMLHCGNV